MKKLNVTYQGFTLGMQTADSIAQWDVKQDVTRKALHSLKNMATSARLMEEVHICGINNKIYTGGI